MLNGKLGVKISFVEEKSQKDWLKIFRHDILQRGLTASMTFKGAAYIIAAVLVPTLGS